MDKVKDIEARKWYYIKETVKNGWSTNILKSQINYKLYERQDTVENVTNNTTNDITTTISYSIDDIPEYDGEIYIEMNDNIPEFDEEDILLEENYYSELDDIGRVRSNND